MIRVLLFFSLFIGLATMQGQIVNEGTFKIQPSTLVYFGDHYTNTGTLTNDGILHVRADFTNNGTVTTDLPTATSITHFNSTNTATQNIYSENGTHLTKFHNLTINNNASAGHSVAVEDNDADDEGVNLEVTNNLTITTGQKLRLKGEAQLIQTHGGGADITGDGHLLKDQQGAKDAHRYNHWSSPVQNDSGGVYTIAPEPTYSTVIKDGTIADLFNPADIGFTSGYNGTNGSPIQLSTYWFWKYVNAPIDPYNYDYWINLFDLYTTNPNLTDDAYKLKVGEGFTMKGTYAYAGYFPTQNYSFEGKPNDGDYTLTISPDSEYLVGNPYPSAMDANQFIDDNIDEINGNLNPIIDGTLYYWHHWSTTTHQYVLYGAGYATYTKGGGVFAIKHTDYTYGPELPVARRIIPKQYIPVGQGFSVRTETTSGGTIKFNNGQRAFKIEGGESAPVKNRNSNGVTARIRLGYEGVSDRHRPLLLAFTNNNATDGFDYGWDGKMIDQWPDDLYFSINNENSISSAYVIQGVGTYNIDAEYPLVLKAKTPGEHVIMIDDLENFEEDLYILDEKGYTHDLRERPYVAYIPYANTTRNLNLVFQPAPTPTDIQDNINGLVNIFYADEEIVIYNDNDVILTGLQVYNSLGQVVYQITKPSQLKGDRVRLAFRNFATSAYFLKVQAQTGTGSYKFINY